MIYVCSKFTAAETIRPTQRPGLPTANANASRDSVVHQNDWQKGQLNHLMNLLPSLVVISTLSVNHSITLLYESLTDRVSATYLQIPSHTIGVAMAISPLTVFIMYIIYYSIW